MRIVKQYRRILVNTKSILCKIRTDKKVLKALDSEFRIRSVKWIERAKNEDR